MTQHTTTTVPANGGRFEGVVQVLIMLAVAGMAGAASFTHVHDWTMHNSPAGTGDWFGWANAMVSELIPLAAGLEVRRRQRRNLPAGRYPLALILGAVALSLTGQFAEAKHSVSGWLISAVPALGFLALVKLVLTRPTGSTIPATVPTTPATAPAPVPVDELPTPTPAVRPVHIAPAPARVPEPVTPVDPEPVTLVDPAEPASPVVEPVQVPTHLLPTARFAVVNHEQHTGRPITAAELAARMSVTSDTAAALLGALVDELPTVPARINGHAVLGGGR